MAGCDPVSYLHDLRKRLSAQERAALWPDGPRLTLEDFGPPEAPVFQALASEQGRGTAEASLTAGQGAGGDAAALVELGASANDGRCWYAIPAHVPVVDKPFGLRVRLRTEAPCDPAIVLSYWFEWARRAAVTLDATSRELNGGWRLFEVRRDFFQERVAEASEKGYDPVGGVIHQMGFAVGPGPVNRISVDSVELFIPEPAEQAS